MCASALLQHKEIQSNEVNESMSNEKISRF